MDSELTKEASSVQPRKRIKDTERIKDTMCEFNRRKSGFCSKSGSAAIAVGSVATVFAVSMQSWHTAHTVYW